MHKRTCLFIRMLLACGLILASGPAFAQEESPQSFTYQGRLMNAAGTAPLANGTYTLRFRILSESGTCVLYHEEQSVSTSSGFFSVQIGAPQSSPNRVNTLGVGATDDPGLTISDVFSNKNVAKTLSNGSCASYTPAPGEVRKLQVENVTLGVVLTPDQVISSVPNAIVSETVQGIRPENFVQVYPTGLSSATTLQTNTFAVDGTDGQIRQWNGTAWTSVQMFSSSVLRQSGAASGQVLKWNGSGWAPANDNDSFVTANAAGDVSGGFANTLTVVGLQGRPVAVTAPTGSQVLQWNGTSWAPATLAGTSGTAGGDLTGSYPSPSVARLQGVAVSTVGPLSGELLRFDGTSWGPWAETFVNTGDNAGGDLSGTYPNPTVDGLQGVAVSATAPSTGQILYFNGTQWVPAPASSVTGNFVSRLGDTMSGVLGMGGFRITGLGAPTSSSDAVTREYADSRIGGFAVSAPYSTISNNMVMMWSNTGWVASSIDLSGAGTVTNIATGPGLTGGPISTTGTLSVDTSWLDARTETVGSGLFVRRTGDTVTGNYQITGTVSASSLLANGASITNDLTVGGLASANTLTVSSWASVGTSLLVNGLARLFGGADLNNQRIQNVATPTASLDAVNRDYVDSQVGALGAQYVRRVGDTVTGNYSISGNLAVGSGALSVTGAASVTSSLTVGGVLDMSNQRVQRLASPTDSLDATNRLYVDSNLGGLPIVSSSPGANQVLAWSGTQWVPITVNTSAATGTVTNVGAGTGLSGGPISSAGTLSLDTAFVTGLVNTADAVNAFVRKAGDTMAGPLNMGGQRIISMAWPTATGDAATRGYVDTVISTLGSGSVTLVAGQSGILGTVNGAGTLTLDGIWVDARINATSSTQFVRRTGDTVTGNYAITGTVNATNFASSGWITSGSSMSVGGQLFMNANRVVNLGAPTATDDAVTKFYADNNVAGLPANTSGLATNMFLKWNGTSWVGDTVASGGGSAATTVTAGTGLDGGTFSTNGTVSINTSWLDARVSTVASGIASTLDSGLFVRRVGDTVTGNFAITGDVSATNVTATGWMSTGSSLLVSGLARLFGGADLNNQRIQNVGSPTSSLDAANRDYVDTQVGGLGSQYVRKSGDTLAGSLIVSGGTVSFSASALPRIDLGGGRVVNSGVPSAAGDLVNKQYSDVYIAGSTVLGGPSANLQVPTWDAGNSRWYFAVPAGTSGASGTVTSVIGGSGLTGGTITNSGTLAIDTAWLDARVGTVASGIVSTMDSGFFVRKSGDTMAGSLFMGVQRIQQLGAPTATDDATTKFYADRNVAGLPANTSGLATNMFLKWNGSAWVGDTVATGGVTNVGTGTGLLGGPISSTGTLTLDTAFVTGLVNTSNAMTAFVRRSGDTMTGSLMMSGQRVQQVGAPTATDDAVTKLYADSQLFGRPSDTSGMTTGRFLMWDGANWVGTTVASGGGSAATTVTAGTGLDGGTFSTNGTVSINTSWLDARVSTVASGIASTLDSGLFVRRVGDTVTGNFAITGDVSATNVTATGWMSTGSSLLVSGLARLFGGADLNNQRIQNVGSPTSSLDAANRDYVDTQVGGLGSQYVRKSGDTMAGFLRVGSSLEATGGIFAGGQRVQNVGFPTALTDAASKQYTDVFFAGSTIMGSPSANLQVPTWDSGNNRWYFAVPAGTSGASGTVTSVIGGTGLAGGTITNSGTLSIDTAWLDARVSGIATTMDSGLFVRKSGDTMAGQLNMGNQRILAVAWPTATADAATKGYVDSAIGTLGTGSVSLVAGQSGILGTVNGAGTLTLDGAWIDSRINATSSTQFMRRSGDTVTGNYAITGWGSFSSSLTLGGSLWMGNQRIQNLGWPTATTDAATRGYTDSFLAGLPLSTTSPGSQQVLAWSGSQWVPTTVNTSAATGTVTNVGSGTGLTGGPITNTGTLALDTAFVTGLVNTSNAVTAFVRKSGDTMAGQLNMGNQRILAVADPTAATDAVNLQTLQAFSGSNSGLFVRRTGDTVTGNYAITGTVNATNFASSGWITSGSSMSVGGQLFMNANRVVNLGAPTATDDAVTKFYADNNVAGLPANTSGLATNMFLKWNGTSWVGDTVASGGGSAATTVTAGTGLDGGTFSTNGTVSINTSWLDARVSTVASGIASTLDSGLFVRRVGDTVTGNFAITGNVSATNLTATGWLNVGSSLAVSGVARLLGGVNMGGTTISGVATPVDSMDAANRLYVDTAVANVSSTAGIGTYVRRSGDTVTGSLVMTGGTVVFNASTSVRMDLGGGRITGVANPTAATEAANKQYSDVFFAGSTIVGGPSADLQVPTWDAGNSRWYFAVPAGTSGASGTVTSVIGGAGIAGGTITNSGTLSIDTAWLDARVNTAGSTWFVRKSGDTMAGQLNMGNQRILAVADPTAATDAVNLQTLQAFSGSNSGLFIRRTGDTVTGNYAITGWGSFSSSLTVGGLLRVNGGINMNSTTITNLAPPVAGTDAANKDFVLSVMGTLGSGTVTSVIGGTGLAGGTITNSGTLSIDTAWLDSRVSGIATTMDSGLFVRKSGDTMAGQLNMGNQRILAVAWPTATADAATKGYVDSAIGTLGSGSVSLVAGQSGILGTINGAGTLTLDGAWIDSRINATSSTQFMRRSGDTVTGNYAITGWGSFSSSLTLGGSLWMGNQRIQNLGWPTATTDAATRGYTDSFLAGLPLSTTSPGSQQVLAWSGSQWVPTTVNTSAATGTVTNVGSGTGLTGGPITNTGTLALDTAFVTGLVNTSNAVTAFVRKAGDTMAGQLNMGNQRILAVADPTAATDAVNLQTLQAFSGSNSGLFVRRTGDTVTGNYAITGWGSFSSSLTVGGPLWMSGQRIRNLASPTASDDAVNRDYVDSITGGLGSSYVRRVGDTVTGNYAITGWMNLSSSMTLGGSLWMGAQRIQQLGAPVATDDAVTKFYSDRNVAGLPANTSGLATNMFLKWNGSAWVGDTINLSGTGTVTSVGGASGILGTVTNSGTLTLDPTYVTGLVNTSNAVTAFVRKSGDTMAGQLNMGNQRILAVAWPTATADAATKGYIDSAIGTLGSGSVTLVAGQSGVLGTVNGAGTLTLDGAWIDSRINATSSTQFMRRGGDTVTGNYAITGWGSFSSSLTLGGSLWMNNQRIQNLGWPTATTDAATRGYSDSFLAGLPLSTSSPGAQQVLAWSGSQWIPITVNTSAATGTVTSVGSGTGLTGGPITNTGTLALDTAFVTGLVNTSNAVTAFVRKAGDTMAGQLNMGNQRVLSVAWPTATADAATKGYVDSAIGTLGTGSVSLVAGQSGILGTVNGAGTLTLDGAWVDSRINATSSTQFVRRNGDTVTGNYAITGWGSFSSSLTVAGVLRANGGLNMNSTTITNLAPPVAGTDAANRDFVLALFGSLGSGTVTNVATGTGLSGGPITSNGTISINTTWLDARIDTSGGGLFVRRTGDTVTGNYAITGWGSYSSSLTLGGPLRANGGINMNGTTITNLASPVAAADAVVKSYSDTMMLGTRWSTTTPAFSANQIPMWTTTGWVATTMNASGTGTVTNVGAGTGLTGGPVTSAGTLAIDTAWLDARIDTSGRTWFVRKVGDTMAGSLWMGAQRIQQLGAPTATDDGVTKFYADRNVAGLPANTSGLATNMFLKWNGSSWVGDTVAAGSTGTVTLVAGQSGILGTISGAGTLTLDGAWVDSRINATSSTQFMRRSGDTVTGNYAITGWGSFSSSLTLAGSLWMGNQRIQNVGWPTATADAATRGYVDSIVGTLAGPYFLKAGDTVSGMFRATANSIIIGSTATNITALPNGSIAFGQGAMPNPSANLNNIGIGPSALASVSTGTGNIGIGSGALDLVSTNSSNVAVGQWAGTSGSLHSASVLVGLRAGYGVSHSHDVFVGGDAGLFGGETAAVTQWNTVIGRMALGNSNAGYFNQNVVIGGYAGPVGSFSTTNVMNTSVLIGYGAQVPEGTSSNNIVIGPNANSTGSGAVVIGANLSAAGNRLAIDNQSTATPLIYGEFDTDQVRINGFFRATSNSISLGSTQTNITALPNGAIGFGIAALQSPSAGAWNVAIGAYSLNATPTGRWNNTVGAETLRNLSSGDGNDAHGYFAGYQLTTGAYNAMFGYQSGSAMTVGNYNSFFGSYAGISNTGSFNTSLGHYSGYQSRGGQNTHVGSYAGYSTSLHSGMNNVMIGYTAGYNETGSNKLHIDSGGWRTTPLIWGDFSTRRVGIDKTALTYTFEVNGSMSASAYYYTSDARLKTNVQTLESALSRIRQLRGVNFDWKSDGSSDLGLIAQEVESIFPEAVNTGADGIKSVKYGNLVAPLIEATKELALRTEASESELVRLKALAKSLSERQAKTERQVASLQQSDNDKDRKIKDQQKQIEDLEKRLQRLEKLLIQSKP